MERVIGLNELTPIEEYYGIFYKRDDKYLPYEKSALGGNKVRQMQYLYSSITARKKIVHGLITNPVSLSSPQSVIVAKIARDNNVPCIICFGGKTRSVHETIKKYKPLELAANLGAEISVVAKIGYASVISKKVAEIAKEINYEVVDFGINLSDYPEAIIESTANQVANYPDTLDNLIIPCGSGLTAAGILVGIKKFNKQIKRIIIIQISGIDRRKTINKILNKFGVKPSYEFVIDTTYPYSKNIQYYVQPDFELNVKYESKAFLYFMRNQEKLNITGKQDTLFHVIGNNNFLFE